MNITSDIFAAYLKCPTKCYLLAHGETGAGNEYANWVRTANEAYRIQGMKRIGAAVAPGTIVTGEDGTVNLKAAQWRFAMDLPVSARNMDSRIHMVERIPSEGRGHAAQFIPVRFIFTNKLTTDNKLLVAYDALVLSDTLGRPITLGRIIHGDDHAALKVKTAGMRSRVTKCVDKITALLSADNAPALILNRHCGECDFQARCRQKAIEEDDLSLLSGMTEKERKKLNSKGIFTVTQLSYTFRPRRRPKRLRHRRERYHHSLKALAIRENKTHIVGTPELKIEGTPVYLDVEGIPDRDFYYLIGLRIGDGDMAVQHSLWADKEADEKTIWKQFLAIVNDIQDPVLIHYGSYETTFLSRASERHGIPRQYNTAMKAVNSPINLLSFLYGRVYFPKYSNGLKDIAASLGHPYPATSPSGIGTIACRHDWESTGNKTLKTRLMEYNTKDCFALSVLASRLVELGQATGMREDIAFPGTARSAATEQGANIHHALETLLKSAHASYNKAKIRLREGREVQSRLSVKKRLYCSRRHKKRPNARGRVISVPRKRTCAMHPAERLRPSSRISSHTLLDLVFSKTGCRKVVVTYAGKIGICPTCRRLCLPPIVKRLKHHVYGAGFHAWVIYQRVALRLSYRLISKASQDIFNERLSIQTIDGFMERGAKDFAPTGHALCRRLLASPVIHIDETQLNVLGVDHYVWVLTDGQHVIFRLTETRETAFLKELLSGYQGIIVTDFYGGYDAMPCAQQKCLVHLIRDLNDDLWKNPFAKDFEQFVASCRDLLVPIIDDVHRFGSKACHLRKHKERVARFYASTVLDDSQTTEITGKYQKRFVRYRRSLFRFLESDGVPWNNNMAERAIRHLAVQRKISGSFSSKGAEQYLGLLAIAQTCRFQDKSFLGFLLSGCRDVDQYDKGRRGSGLSRDHRSVFGVESFQE